MATVKVKAGVQPRLVHIMAGIASVADKWTDPTEIWITSAFDSAHSTDSLHYALRAVDVRTKNFPSTESKQRFKEALQAELGPAFQVILESLGQPNEHIHVEFDPS